MSRFRIKVVRIEAAAQRGQVFITFQIEREKTSFQVPIRLSASDYDDTEMIQAARGMLHGIFADLAVQSRVWKLSAEELRQLSRMSLRPAERPARASDHSTPHPLRGKSRKLPHRAAHRGRGAVKDHT
jgi:hypothetical protein